MLYKHINLALQNKTSCFTERDYRIASLALSQFFQMMSGYSYKSFAKNHRYDGSKYSEILSEFYIHSVEFKHISKNSAQAELWHIFKFLESSNLNSDKMHELSAINIRDYVSKSLSNLNASSIGRYITSIRNFFKLLEFKGYKVVSA